MSKEILFAIDRQETLRQAYLAKLSMTEDKEEADSLIGFIFSIEYAIELMNKALQDDSNE